jgi:hypothetical protein
MLDTARAVVNRANFRKLEGVVGLPDILGAYRAAG